MKNIELECMPAWRFCNIPRGQKGPRSAGWQRMPLLLTDIDPAGNVGVLLGPQSGGLCALDFDGTTAWSWFQQHFDIEIPATVMWASGKTDRCQMAFAVPEAYWDALKTLKIATGEHEGFEFRWSGAQSVVPPSLHPDTQQEYFWVHSPSDFNIAELPIEALEYWMTHVQAPREYEDAELPPIDFDKIKEDQFDHLVALLEQLKGFYGRPDHDTWLRWAYATASEVGPAAAAEVMNVVWPEEKRGEYKRLLRTWKQTRSPKLSTLERAVKERTERPKKIIKNDNAY